MTPLPPEREGCPAPEAIAALRLAAAGALAKGQWRTRRPVEEQALAGRRVLRVSPQGTPVARVLHFHGGGYRMGLPEMDAPFAEALADACGAEVLLVQYRLAPEHPFPAGLNDARAVLGALPADLPLIAMGGSAGGGLAAALAVIAAPRLAGLVLLSPWLDLRVAAPSYAANAGRDRLFSREAAEAAAALYLQGAPADHPLASPVLAPLAGLPPVLTSVGTGEVLLDDSRLFHRRLGEAGVASTLLEIDGMDHVAVSRSLDATGAAETLAAVAGFITDCLKP